MRDNRPRDAVAIVAAAESGTISASRKQPRMNDGVLTRLENIFPDESMLGAHRRAWNKAISPE